MYIVYNDYNSNGDEDRKQSNYVFKDLLDIICLKGIWENIVLWHFSLTYANNL